MSFSSQVKNELSRILSDDKCCILCELSSIIRIGSYLTPQKDGYISVKLSTENAAFTRRVILNAVHVFDFHPSVITRKSRKLKKHNLYVLNIKGTFATRNALNDMGLIDLDKNIGIFSPIDDIAGDECCYRSFLRGAFLASGSVSDPEKTYHLEIVSQNKGQIEEVARIMGKYGINAKIIFRRNYYVCYLKESENIVDFLNITGAHNALLKYENTRILKDLRNNVNRAVNCETANLSKTVNTSYRQVEAIEFIEKTAGLDILSDNLKQIALIRLENKEASLIELGKMMTPELGKSGVNHRLKKIEEIAENLRNKV